MTINYKWLETKTQKIVSWTTILLLHTYYESKICKYILVYIFKLHVNDFFGAYLIHWNVLILCTHQFNKHNTQIETRLKIPRQRDSDTIWNAQTATRHLTWAHKHLIIFAYEEVEVCDSGDLTIIRMAHRASERGEIWDHAWRDSFSFNRPN